MPGSSRRHSTTPEYTCRDPTDRRHSTSSDTSLPDSSHFQQLSQENIEYIPTRMKQVTASKLAANPLQFVKVGPCELYRSAQEQLKKVEEVKKLKQEVKEEAEDWQSNLDNWKSSRRKRQEHIIERVVEVKKFELEEFDRNRRRSKTFNEMMEERNTRGRKMSLVMYKEEDANDFSDLGIGTSSGKSSVCGDYGNDDSQSTSDREELDKHRYETHNGNQGKNGMNGHHEETSALATGSSPEPEEYTYERAIQSYVDFTATRVKSKPVGRKSLSSSREELDDTRDKLPNGHSTKSPPPPPVKPRRESNPKVEARLSALEQRRRSSTDLNSIPDSSRVLPLPKIDVLKRRELFEKALESNEQTSKMTNKKSGNLSTTQSIKERLSNLEKQTDASNNTSKGNSRISGEISSSVKERLSSLQKQRSTDNLIEKDTVKASHRLSSGDISSSQSIRARLSHLEKQNSAGDANEPISPNRHSGDFSHSIKERLSSLDAACSKDNAKRVTPDRDPSFRNKLANFRTTETSPQGDEPEYNNADKNDKVISAESERSASPDDEEIYPTKRQQFHRSLDSLDVETSTDVVNEAFERVQSLEDLDCCNRARNYPASASSTEMLAFSSQSGDTDREDSGIHTADVSCSVSQADEPVEDGEIITTISSVVPHFELDKNGHDSYHLEVELVNHKRQGSGISGQLSPIPQEECNKTCTAFLHVDSSAGNNIGTSKAAETLQLSQESKANIQTSSSYNVSPQLSDISVAVGGHCNLTPDIPVHDDSSSSYPVLTAQGDINNGGGSDCVTAEQGPGSCSVSLVQMEENSTSDVINLNTVSVTDKEINQIPVSVTEKEEIENDDISIPEVQVPINNDNYTQNCGDGDTKFLFKKITTSGMQNSEIPSNPSTSEVIFPIDNIIYTPENPLKPSTEEIVPKTGTHNTDIPPDPYTSELLSPTDNIICTPESPLKSQSEVTMTEAETQDYEMSPNSFSPEAMSHTNNIICTPENPLKFPTEGMIMGAGTQTSDISFDSFTPEVISPTDNIISTPEIPLKSPNEETVMEAETQDSEISPNPITPEVMTNTSTHDNPLKSLSDETVEMCCAETPGPEMEASVNLERNPLESAVDTNPCIEEPVTPTISTPTEEGIVITNVCPPDGDVKIDAGEEVVGVCLRIKLPGASADKRKTVMEVCEKVDISQVPGGLKSPPPTPFISVSTCFQEPTAMPQEEIVIKSTVTEVAKEPAQQEVMEDIYYPASDVVDNTVREIKGQIQDILPPNEETPSNMEGQIISEKGIMQTMLAEKSEYSKKQLEAIALPRFLQNNSRMEEESAEIFLLMSTSQIPQLSLSSDVEIVSGLSFPLGPPSSAEPPKEKPPPPPTELSDEETPLPESPLRRLDSTKRIKKEIRRKRSDFLGIEGKTDDDSYLEPELQVSRPPDMTSFLVEERRLEQQLYRQSICSESDSNLGETTESRDSGVELERGQSDDAWSSKQPLTPDVLSAQHSRQNSELYGNASITSEEDEITKKEREIIEILEKEEQWRYGNNTSNQQDIGEKLAVKLRQLEQEKMRLEWERTEEANARREEELRLQAKEEKLRQQEENLRSERERLQREQESLLRQKESLQAQVQHQHQRWSSHSALPSQQWDASPLPTHLSLQDVSNVPGYPSPTTPAPARPAEPLNYRLSLPDLQQDPQAGVVIATAGQSLRPSPARRAPPPIPPAKPLRVVSQEQRERDNSIRSSRMPSADALPQQMEPAHMHQNSVPVQGSGGQQMSRQTLQALSAVPRSRLITNDTWIQAKKKPEGHRNTLNNQHWLIQEAEHRRITEQHQRNATSPRKTLPPQYWAQQQQQQPLPSQRQDKPLPDAIIQTLTQRVQSRTSLGDNKKASSRIRVEESPSRDSSTAVHYPAQSNNGPTAASNPPMTNGDSQEKMLSVSGKKKCSHCGEELGRGAAMIIESLRLFYHIDCFKCCVCHVQLGDGLMGTDVRVRNNKLHCHNCYSSDDGVKFSCV